MCIRDRNIRKAASGLLVETLIDEQGSKLLKVQNIDVEAVPHTTLNTTREEITTELASQGVNACRRLTVRRDGQTLQYGFHVLSFTGQPHRKLSEQAFIG